MTNRKIGALPRVRADFTLFGTPLPFDIIQQKLPLLPDQRWHAGDPIPQTSLIEQQDGWRITTGYIESWSAEDVIASLLARLHPIHEHLAALRHTFPCEFELAIIIDAKGNSFPSLNLSPNLLTQIAAIDCTLDVDIYA